MIVTLRRLGMTAAEIAECLSMPASTVSAVLTRIGLGRLSRLERPEAPNRYERRRAGELLHIDVKKLVRIAGAGHRVTGSRRGQAQGIGWEFVHIAIDDATRIAYVEVLDEKKATTAVGFLRRAVAHFATYGPRSRLPDAQNPPPAHQALPTTNERQGRALHPHAPWRLGLRCDLRKLNRADTSAHRLAQLLQSHPTTRLPRPPTATRATRGPHEQRGWVLQLGAFVGLYAFLSQIIPYGDSDLERLSSYGRALLPHLHPGPDRGPVRLGGDVQLEYYRLQQVSSGPITIDEEEAPPVTSPTAVGTGNPEEKQEPLSQIIERLNERYGTDFTDEDRLFFEQVKERAARDEHVRQTALANTLDKFSLGIRPQIEKLMIERIADNDTLVTRYMNDPEFQELVFTGLTRAIYQAVETSEQPDE